MPIPVVCPGCKASFNVSDKFAGKQGPCPKCKTSITIPKLDAAKPVEEVKIHAPEESASGPKGSTGRPVLKPIARSNARLNPFVAGGIVVVIIALYLLAWMFGDMVKRPFEPDTVAMRNEAVSAPYYSQLKNAYAIRAAVLLVISLPVIWAGYMILRDDELDPFRGRALWMRVGICYAVYLLLWGGYALLPADYVLSWYAIALIAIPIFLVGFATAYYTFDFDPTSAAVHFLFYIVVTILLGVFAGLTMPWSDGLQTKERVVEGPGTGEAATEAAGPPPLYDAAGQPMNEAAEKEQKALLEAEKNKKAGTPATRPAPVP